MVVNIILLLFVFGASKKKLSPYIAAAIFGGIKAVIYYIGSKSIIVALIAFVIFFGLVAGMVYFFAKLDKREAVDDPTDMYSSNPKEEFKWEYIPITTFVLLIVGGELLVTMLVL